MSVRNNAGGLGGKGSYIISGSLFHCCVSTILNDVKCYPRIVHLVPTFAVKETAQRRENSRGNKTFQSWIRTLNISPSVFQASVLNIFPCGGGKDISIFFSRTGTKYHWIKEACINQSTSKRFLISCLEQQNLQCIIFLMLSWRNLEEINLSLCSQTNTEIVFSRLLK